MTKINNQQESIGCRLSKLRVEMGIGVVELSQRLKIKEQYINAIESDNFETFSSSSHVKGFIRNISKELGFNPELAIKLYNRDNEVKQGFKKASQEVQLEEVGTSPFKKIMITLFISFWFILFFVVYNQISSNNQPKLIITYPVYIDAATEERYVLDWESDEIIIRGDIQAGNSLHINNQISETFGMERFESPPIKLNEGENKVSIRTKNQYGITDTVELVIFK